MRKFILFTSLLFSFALANAQYNLITYQPEFTKPVKFDTYITFRGTQLNYISGDSLANLAYIRSYVSTHGAGGTNYFSLTGSNVFPSSTSNNLLAGIATNPSNYKLYVYGGATINGSVKSIGSSGDIAASNFTTNFTSQNLTINNSGLSNSAIGSSNIFIGNIGTALYGASSIGNTILGSPAGSSNNILYNTLIGSGAGVNMSGTNTSNTLLGYNSGANLDLGSSNTLIGAFSGNSLAGSGSTGSYGVMLGYQAGFNETNSNRLYIANNKTTPMIYGVFPNSYLQINAVDSIALSGNLMLRQVNPKIYFASNYVGMTATNDFKINVAGIDVWRSYTASAKKINVITADTIKTVGVFLVNGLSVMGGGSSLIGLTQNASPWNVTLGYQAGNSLTTGASNTFIGTQAGFSNTTGYSNTFMGKHAGYSNTTGQQNVMIGDSAGLLNTSGSNNIFIGTFSGRNTNVAFSTNTFVGNNSGYTNTVGNSNVYLGDNTGYSNNTGYANVFLGSNAGYSETGSNKLYISNSSTSTPLIKGDFTAKTVTINGAEILPSTMGSGYDTIAGSQGSKNVAGVRIIRLIANPGGIITLNSLAGGVANQLLTIGSIAAGTSLYIKNNTGTGQKIFLTSGADTYANSTSGWIDLICDGTSWHQH